MDMILVEKGNWNLLLSVILPNKGAVNVRFGKKFVFLGMPMGVAEYFVFTVFAQLFQIKFRNINAFFFACLEDAGISRTAFLG